jgi:hypothetical protein
VIVYTANWRRGRNVIRGSFAPLDGDLKPDDEDTRKLLKEENVAFMYPNSC